MKRLDIRLPQPNRNVMRKGSPISRVPGTSPDSTISKQLGKWGNMGGPLSAKVLKATSSKFAEADSIQQFTEVRRKHHGRNGNRPVEGFLG